MSELARFDHQMTADERRATWGLGLLFSLRMLGMFMVLPVLTTYGMALQGATPSLIGLAIGIYGLAQALCQIPLGVWSDRLGRLPLIVAGLLLFALGAVVAALSDSIWGVILGRGLQGAGAISAVVLALLSDLTREQNRTKAMAVIGMSFGITFAIAMVTGPLLAQHFGIRSLFWGIALLAVLAIGVVLWVVPRPASHLRNRESAIVGQGLRQAWAEPRLQRLYLGIFSLHLLLMMSFVALPDALVKVGLERDRQWLVYLITLLISFVAVLPGIIYAEKQRQTRRVFLGAILLLCVGELLLCGGGRVSLLLLLLGLQLFFVAFNLLEALLPSLISKEAPAGLKGTAMGLYSTAQFLGVALGGMLGGWLLEHMAVGQIFMLAALLAGLWWLRVRQMQEPAHVSSLRLQLTVAALRDPRRLQEKLLAQPGVQQVLIVSSESSAYIKVDTRQSSRLDLEALVAAG